MINSDPFLMSLPTVLRNCLLGMSLSTEQRIRDSFARDGGKSIANQPNIGEGMMNRLRGALERAYDARVDRGLKFPTIDSGLIPLKED